MRRKFRERNTKAGSLRAQLWLKIPLLLGLLISLYPFETTVVPEWRVRVADEVGNPLKKTIVSEHWKHYSIESEGHEAEAITDGDGYITFPPRTIKASLLIRVIGLIRNVFKTGIHASFGPSAYLIVSGDMDSITTNADYSPDKPLPEQIIRRRIK
jgi:hypothetical protein